MSKPLGIYVRVSRKGDREDERFHSPREQRERAEALARAKGFAVGPLFEDIDVSGGTHPDKRPAMADLLKQIKAGKLGGIAAYSLDRLSRDPAHGDDLVKAVTKAGGVLLTPDMPEAMDTPTGEFTFGMLLQVAKLYRSQAGARFASAKARATLAGIPVSTVPVGYRQRPDRRLEVDPAVAPTIREMFERRAKGAGWTELANLLSQATGRTWSLRGAYGVVSNRLYATGRLQQGDIVSEWDAGAIVDEPLWHAAQTAKGLAPKRKADSPWLLTGIARCATCGHSLAGWTGGQRRRRGGTGPHAQDWVEVPEERRARRYRCPNRRCQDRANVEAGRLERYAYLRAVALEHELSTAGGEGPDLGTLEDALGSAERRLAQVLGPEAQDALGDAWAATVKARRQERDAAAAALGEAQVATGSEALQFQLEEVWDDLSNDDRRAALAMFWKEIRVGKKARAKSRGAVPLTLVARGPFAEAEVTLDNEEAA